MMRMLLVRLGALGDLVHALPFAAALRAAHPDARIDWLVDVRYRALLDLVPIVSERLTLNTRAWRGPTALPAVIRRLRLASYDIAFDAQGLIKSALLARASGATRVVGFARPALREPAAAMFYTETIDPAGATHVIDKTLRLLRAIGIDPPAIAGHTPIVTPASAAAAWASTSTTASASTLRSASASADARDARERAMVDRAANPASPGASAAWRFPLDAIDAAGKPLSPVPACTREVLGIAADAPFVLINPGAAWPNKRWPADRFATLAREVQARHGLKSAVLWGPGEETLAAQIARASGGAAEMAPATTLADVLALAREARMLVSGDTGPTHLAAAVGTPIVGLYGPTDPARNGPWHPDDICVSRFAACACHHQRRCHRPATWCLADITVEEVMAAVDQRLAHVH